MGSKIKNISVHTVNHFLQIMQQSTRWKAAANLDLLLGIHHPAARIVSDYTAGSQINDGGVVDARNSVNFRDTMYCNRQDYGSNTTRRRLAGYYRYMLSKINLWEADGGGVILKGEEENPTDIKQEERDDVPSLQKPNEGSLYRARGILTQLCSPLATEEELLLPWEFFPIVNVDDDDTYAAPIRAMTKDVAPTGGFLRIENEDDDDGGATGGATDASGGEGASYHRNNPHSVSRLSLYTRLTPQFTGLYSGMVVGIVGEPFKRSSSGALTAVLVRRFILPSRPQFPWGIERPIPTALSHFAIPTRIHFCSGPFPRRETGHILNSVTLNALHRGADLLIIGGPLVREFEEYEKDSLKLLQLTFDELLSSYMDTIEETMEKYYASSKNPRTRDRMKVVLVPHRDDVTQIPAIPITMYSLESTDSIWVRSNPCRIAVNGIHIGVCNDDVVGDMREKMVERWPTESGSLRRVVEALVQSRLYAPLYEFPAVKHDLQHIGALRLDFLPPNPEGRLPKEDISTSALTWDAVRLLSAASVLNTLDSDDDTKQEVKRVKQEEDDQLVYPTNFSKCGEEDSTVEWMPHLLFLPSTRPRFAFVTHQHNEEALDDPAAASGVMVVNQEVWCRRTAPRFELRVAEVTVEDSERVVCRGASEVNGVVCGVIHFTNIAAAA